MQMGSIGLKIGNTCIYKGDFKKIKKCMQPGYFYESCQNFKDEQSEKKSLFFLVSSDRICIHGKTFPIHINYVMAHVLTVGQI